jgi:signal transduction histidine kinase
MTNIAKHSKATTVRLSARSLPGVIELCVRDNGRGFEPAAAHSGNGLRNMHWRAAALGATLVIDGRDGASLVLALPV